MTLPPTALRAQSRVAFAHNQPVGDIPGLATGLPFTVGEDVEQWAYELGAKASSRISREFGCGVKAANGPIEVVDLFSGCGGLSAGFEFVGRLVRSYRLAAAADIDADSNQTYANNLGIRPIQADLAAASRTEPSLDTLVASFCLRRSGPLVVVGGPPCQGFSAHRKMDDRNDKRNRLVHAFSRVVSRLSPDFVVFENVPEVLSKKRWGVFETLRQTLEDSGLTVRAQIYNLATFGVPQARFRAVVMAAPWPFSMPRGYLELAQAKTVRSAIGHLPPVAPGERSNDPMHYCTRHRATTIRTIRRIRVDGGRRAKGVGPKCLDRVDGFRDVYGRMYWDRPANTITGFARNPASGRYIHPEQDRGLTIREAALLQGFPETFNFDGSFDHRFQQIGNAVPPIFSAFLAAHILGQLLSRKEGHLVCAEGSDILSPVENSYSSGLAARKQTGN